MALFAGCALGPGRQQAISDRLAAERGTRLDCPAPADCASPSPFHALIDGDAGQRHRALLLEGGADALRIRLHLIRSARRSIDIQTYIFQHEASSEGQDLLQR